MKIYTAETFVTNLTTLPKWKFENNSIERKFVFKDFAEAMSFMIRVSYTCEAMNHHPDWTNVYNKLTIRLSTHDAGGVTDKDIELATAIDRFKDQ